MPLQRVGDFPSPHYHQQQSSQWPGREDNLDAKGLHLVWLSEGALLLKKPRGLGSAAVVYDSKLNNGHCAISYGYKLSTTSIELNYHRTALIALSTYSG